MMTMLRRSTLMAVALAAAFALAQVGAQEPRGAAEQALASARPSDSTANWPSDSGAQTTLPSGAVTGAGHAQVSTPADAVREPEGLEARARAEAATDAARGSTMGRSAEGSGRGQGTQ